MGSIDTCFKFISYVHGRVHAGAAKSELFFMISTELLCGYFDQNSVIFISRVEIATFLSPDLQLVAYICVKRNMDCLAENV